jgi:hypothetical protein
MAKVITAPEPLPLSLSHTSLFLAGSIENGKATQWQDELCELLKDQTLTILNPRRKTWDETWTEGNPKLSEQINWELAAIEQASHIAFYFDPNTKSPITLLELGLALKSDKAVTVCCPKGYWRRQNVIETYQKYRPNSPHQFFESKADFENSLLTTYKSHKKLSAAEPLRPPRPLPSRW